MSSATTSSSNFQSLFDAALSDYTKQTGINLATQPFAQDLQYCHSADDLLNVLQERAKQFQTYRDGNRKLLNCLKPIVQTLHTVSGVLAEASSPVSTTDQPSYFIIVFTCLAPGPLPTYKGNYRWHRCPPRRTCLLSIIERHPYNTSVLQAAIGVSASYDALIGLLECVGSFLDRLRIYAEIPFSPSMSKIIIKIMVEVLSVLSLATKQVKEGRLSKTFFILFLSCLKNLALEKFAKKLLGETEIEDVLQRLDRLTLDEAKMTGIQTLEVLHGLVANVKLVMDGMQLLPGLILTAHRTFV